MEGLKLGDRELQYYAELFQACDVEGSGKITGPKASELFLASGLSPDILKQITELCGAKRLGHFGRSQFYIALRLVAIGQAGLPLKLDTLNPGKDIPLPKFSSAKGNEQALADRKKSSGEPDGVVTADKPSGQLSGQLPPPPGSKKSHSRSLSGQYRGVVPDGPPAQFNSTTQSNTRDESPHNSKSPPFSPTQSPPTSPANQKPLLKQHTAPAMMFPNSTASGGGAPTQAPPLSSSSMDNMDSTAPPDRGHVNPVAMGDGAAVGRGQAGPAATAPGGQGHNHGHQRPLSGEQQPGQENGSWTMFEDEDSQMLIGSGLKQHYNSLEPPNFDSSSISSEAESVDDVWSITEEQRDYYVNQFKTMQPDLNAVITGPVAKHFFEKSKLPVVELSKIWQLSDLNCDGALSLEEFCIAMHLVVLRRNDIELPEHLPISLMPYSALASDEPFAADLPPGSTLKRATPPSPQNVAQWTAFVQESDSSSGVPSPAHLANFEFAKPSADPELKIVQPVAVRMSPEGLPMQNEGVDRGRAFSDSAVPHEPGGADPGELTPPLTKQRANTESHPLDSSQSETPNSKYSTPIQGRPRPVPPKKQSAVPVVVRGQLQPPPGTPADAVSSNSEQNASGHSSQAPPTPPPRPPHGRSMSVDVKSNAQMVAPAVPPRVSPKEVSQAQSAPKSGDVSAPVSEGTVVVQPLDAPSGPENSQPAPVSAEKDLMEDEDTADNSGKDRLQPKPAMALRQVSRDRRDILMAVRTHKERNTMLTRLNSELNQELQEVMEQRIALEIQLEHLRPFSS
ncbi:ralBP1-associated Eps domain-containing protein 1 isoform X2 [Aplysia californica]|uniref:RalBP1-associated Eps domain-containing protein 1 isoform X2 n=1 Tax=Aplysia californica TaxID=6500 RepID=A0ABM1VT13_APLCA|nr:ralBP1-associated Eps domain-containing protein 1 isoform X2 [Aplysia californica]